MRNQSRREGTEGGGSRRDVDSGKADLADLTAEDDPEEGLEEDGLEEGGSEEGGSEEPDAAGAAPVPPRVAHRIAQSAPESSVLTRLALLQRTAGNAAVVRLLREQQRPPSGASGDAAPRAPGPAPQNFQSPQRPQNPPPNA